MEVNPHLVTGVIEDQVEQELDQEESKSEDYNDEQSDGEPEGMMLDDFEERDEIQFYFRMDEGSGDTAADVSDMKQSLILKPQGQNAPWSTETLKDGDPMEFEDNWGKTSIPNFSVDVTHIQGQKLMLGSFGSIKARKEYTLEFWCQDVMTDFQVLAQHKKHITLSLKNNLIVANDEDFVSQH